MLDFKLLNSQAFLNGELIFRAFLNKVKDTDENDSLILPDGMEKKGDVYDFMLLWQAVETFKKCIKS